MDPSGHPLVPRTIPPLQMPRHPGTLAPVSGATGDCPAGQSGAGCLPRDLTEYRERGFGSAYFLKILRVPIMTHSKGDNGFKCLCSLAVIKCWRNKQLSMLSNVIHDPILLPLTIHHPSISTDMGTSVFAREYMSPEFKYIHSILLSLEMDLFFPGLRYSWAICEKHDSLKKKWGSLIT